MASGLQYKDLLTTAREEAEMRYQRKGLSGRKRSRFVDEDDSDKLGASLVPKRTNKYEGLFDSDNDFLTETFNRVYDAGKDLGLLKLKEEAGDLPTGEAAGLKVISDAEEKELANFKPSETGNNLMGDLEEIFGLSPEVSAGIVGNLSYETGNFKFMQEIKPTVKGSKGGYGFAQWTGPRRREFEKFAEDNNYKTSSYEANLGFLVQELQGSHSKTLEKLQDASSAEEATRIFMKEYLRPGIPNVSKRITAANQYYKGQ